MWLWIACLVLGIQSQVHAEVVRDKAFHGYSEKGKVNTSIQIEQTQPTAISGAQCRDHNPACIDWASKGECVSNPIFMREKCALSCKVCQPGKLDMFAHHDKMLVLRTTKGDVHIKPMWSNAPKTAALIMDLAAQGQEQKNSCRFYRNEAIPHDSEGPPYGLLQGSLAGMIEVPAMEGVAPPVRGAAAMITGTSEFYLSLMDHSSWGSAHIVWGEVQNMQLVDDIVNGASYRNFTHPSFGTVMRMMLTELPFIPMLVSQATQQAAEL